MPTRTYLRTDYFSCGHTYAMNGHGRSIQIEQCPQCQREHPSQTAGTYEFSRIEGDRPRYRPTVEERAQQRNSQGPTMAQSHIHVFEVETDTCWCGTTRDAATRLMGSDLTQPVPYASTSVSASTGATNGVFNSLYLSPSSIQVESIGQTPFIITGQSLPEGHPLPEAEHNAETCFYCQGARDEQASDEVEMSLNERQRQRENFFSVVILPDLSEPLPWMNSEDWERYTNEWQSQNQIANRPVPWDDFL